mmetsp:Transcript_21711/g.38962  ORF Transcript_21711/g.38962 Transcript_21711/m.38962 type:complete len:283 (+) Transcript_21711:1359-2207(+)
MTLWQVAIMGQFTLSNETQYTPSSFLLWAIGLHVSGWRISKHLFLRPSTTRRTSQVDVGALHDPVCSMLPVKMVLLIFGITFIDRTRSHTVTKSVTPHSPLSRYTHRVSSWALEIEMVQFHFYKFVIPWLFSSQTRNLQFQECLNVRPSGRKIWKFARVKLHESSKKISQQATQQQVQTGLNDDDEAQAEMTKLLQKIDEDFLKIVQSDEDPIEAANLASAAAAQMSAAQPGVTSDASKNSSSPAAASPKSVDAPGGSAEDASELLASGYDGEDGSSTEHKE